MNILILFTQPWKTGGAETHVEALLKGLSDHNIVLAVNTGSNKEKLKALKSKYNNVKIVEINSRGVNIFKWQKSFAMLKKIIKSEQIDIISAQQRTAGIWAWRLKKTLGINFTVTMHDPWHRAKFKTVYSKIFPKMIVVSQNLRKVLVEQYKFSDDRIFLINNGIDFNLYKADSKLNARRRLSIDVDKNIILHVSRLSNVKGAVSLAIIDALEYLAQHNYFYNLIIIGEGPLRKKIEDRVTLFNQRYGHWIEVKDFVNNISDWYNVADILIGEGRVAIESLSCGKPVVAIRNDKSYIGLLDKNNIAYACDVNFDGDDKSVNKENLSISIQQAFSQDEMENKYILEYIKSRLSINKMKDGYLSLFRDLLNKDN